jgi:hypothetical protein
VRVRKTLRFPQLRSAGSFRPIATKLSLGFTILSICEAGTEPDGKPLRFLRVLLRSFAPYAPVQVASLGPS